MRYCSRADSPCGRRRRLYPTAGMAARNPSSEAFGLFAVLGDRLAEVRGLGVEVGFCHPDLRAKRAYFVRFSNYRGTGPAIFARCPPIARRRHRPWPHRTAPGRASSARRRWHSGHFLSSETSASRSDQIARSPRLRRHNNDCGESRQAVTRMCICRFVISPHLTNTWSQHYSATIAAAAANHDFVIVRMP